MSDLIVIAGGAGFLGGHLTKQFTEAGHHVTILDRQGRAPAGATAIKWDGKSNGDWASALEGAQTLINLCGSPITEKWTTEARAKILASRIEPTNLLGEVVGQLSSPPPVWINASAVGFFGDSGAKTVDESTPVGQAFLGETCKAWEAALFSHDLPKTRKVAVRIGVVLGQGGGALAPLERLTKMFIGGAVGSGRQYVSWVHVGDLARLFDWCRSEPVEGPLVACAPTPITNADLMAALRARMGRPFAPPVPEFVFRPVCLAGGMQPDVLLSSTRAVPTIALARGFKFQFPTIDLALADLIRLS